ncbi:hypothetical protein D0T12_30045 [Actinomadura spongiicola]|uniref:Glycoside-hydrolase family GH114 TIM-barrel domain-containing protein n=1 Tax=Actinomadura spongiicola TaxID=2303421 RepID=A0A372G970_9ACTN|nr:endo alpha-1,4 polygalactosaminidase [Actinomadura spongiicola]RFS81948.1 hypothetical protein D0T12_30045 [Actinomadura spongiicola]
MRRARGNRLRTIGAVLAALALLVGTIGSVQAKSSAKASSAAWWQPRPGEAKNWDWQIDEPYNVSRTRTMYDLDLWELADGGPNSYLEYPGHPELPRIHVEEGALAGKVDELHRKGAKVICYLDSGAYEHDENRADRHLFPGFKPNLADIPDNPTRPEPDSVIGWHTNDGQWPGERYLDIRRDSWPKFAHLIWARFALAKRLGCDGVEPDQNDMGPSSGNSPGWEMTDDDQIDWYLEVARQAHALGLSVGLKNGHDLNDRTRFPELVNAFDWALPEECVSLEQCGNLSPFIAAGKAVFAVDYTVNSQTDRRTCQTHVRYDFDGIIKDEPPTSAYRLQCKL